MAYLLDADAFIRAKNLHYGFDLCPGFWDWLVTGGNRVFGRFIGNLTGISASSTALRCSLNGVTERDGYTKEKTL